MNWFSLLFGPHGWGPLLATGAVTTLLLVISVVPFGFGGGLILALLKSAPNHLVRMVTDTYTTFFRGIPDLLALFIVYFGLQALVDKITRFAGTDDRLEVNAFLAGVIALSVVVASYSSEVWIASLKSIPTGQIEAARALGLDRQRVFVFVVLPQLGRVALPGLGNIWTILVKDTSLISTLSVMDLRRAASEASRVTTRPILFYTVAAAFYLVVGILSNVVQGYLERRANRGYA